MCPPSLPLQRRKTHLVVVVLVIHTAAVSLQDTRVSTQDEPFVAEASVHGEGAARGEPSGLNTAGRAGSPAAAVVAVDRAGDGWKGRDLSHGRGVSHTNTTFHTNPPQL